jgi:hypothetical protein
MALRQTVRQRVPSPELAAVVVANALPLVGVVALGWNLVALVVVYWFELGILALWAVVRALFAGRPSEFDGDPLVVGAIASKRRALSLPFTDVAIQLSSLPVLAVTTPVLGVVWFLAGVMTVGVLGEMPDPATLDTIVLALVGLFVSEGLSTAIEWFARGGYRDHSAQTAISGVFLRATVVAVGGMITAVLVAGAASGVSSDDSLSAVDPGVVGPPVLVAIVLVKFGFDLAGVYRDRLVEFDENSHLDFGWAYDPPTPREIDPLAAVDGRVRPSRTGRLLGGLVPSWVVSHPGALVPGGLLWFVSLLFVFGGVWDVVLLLVAAGVGVSTGLLAVDWWLRYGGIEYRRSDGTLVASDRLFGTRLWRVESGDERAVRVERDRLDRWLGTSTVVLERRDDVLVLPHLRAPAVVLDVFDRSLDYPENG